MSFTLTNNFFAHARSVTYEDGSGVAWSFDKNTNRITASVSGSAAGANPTAKVGITAVNGSTGTFMRSDAAPPIDQAIVPTWTGLHIFNGGLQIAQNHQTGSTYTLASSDRGGQLYCSGASAMNLTVPSGVFSPGDKVEVAFFGGAFGAANTITQGTGMTLYLDTGAGTTGNRSAKTGSVVILRFITSSAAIVSGSTVT